MKRLVFIITSFIFLYSLSVSATGDINTGKVKSITCTACHGNDGNSVIPQYPKLAGQGAPYLLKQLQDYKNGRRNNPIMTGMVASLSNQDMEDIAEYFASQSVSKSTDNSNNITQGEYLFRGGNLKTGVPACTACHGLIGQGNPIAIFPRLANQHGEYIENQLKLFRNMERTNDINNMMQDITAKMSDAEIKAVSNYLQQIK